LNQAAGNSPADYQGYGRFWDLPYEEFLSVEIFDIRMIAPETEGSGGACGGVPVPVPSAPSGASSTSALPPPTGKPAGGGCCSSEAPEEASCCGGGGGKGGEDSPPRKDPGRGERSGLIQGLRGQFPFDGTQFPRLPWGGAEVSAADIQLISTWIDDGCPREDGEKPAPPPEKSLKEMCKTDYPVAVKPTNALYHEQGKAKIRKNYENLTPQELCKLRCAVGALKELDSNPADNRSFNAWARVHGDHCQHGWEQFLPWHRAYLYKFELAIQHVVPDVTLPYWDWTMAMYQKGAVPKGRQSAILPTGMRCFLDAAALKALADGGSIPAGILRKLVKIENDSQGSDPKHLYNSTWELFVQADLTADDYIGYSLPVIDQLARTNPLWHRFRYPGMFYEPGPDDSPKKDKKGNPILAQPGSKGSLAQASHHHYPTAEEVAQILALNNWPDFGGGHFANQSFGMLSQNPHNTGHIWSGGENPFYSSQKPNDPEEPQYGSMFVDLVAFFDPIGYAHHSNIDRLWWQWQKNHPGANPDDLTDYLSPFGVSVNEMLDIHKLGYDYVKDARAWELDSGQELTHLKTEKAGLPETAFEGHRKVEVRFHNVRRAVKSYVVRVFLNLPEADVNTPTVGNDHYVGYFGRFGHGPCIGGPGHCDPPPSPLPFEKPTRHHNTPQNYRLDATACVAKLLAQGEKDFHVNVVVVHGNGGASEGLKMDSVSLHVID